MSATPWTDPCANVIENGDGTTRVCGGTLLYHPTVKGLTVEKGGAKYLVRAFKCSGCKAEPSFNIPIK